jgi:ankyrin repeat protein
MSATAADASFIVACKSGDTDAAIACLQRNIDPNALTASRYAGLHYAAWLGHEALVTALVSRENVIVDVRGKSGYTPLHLAVREGHLGVARLLVPKADVNAKSQDRGTPLMYASRQGSLDMLRLLLGLQGLEINARNSRGETAFMVAVKSGRLPVVDIWLNQLPADYRSLIMYGLADADTGTEDDKLFGDNPFTAACRATSLDHIFLARYLLEHHGAEISPAHVDANGHNGLAVAVLAGNHQLAEDLVLLSDVLNFNVNQPDRLGMSPFHHACASGDRTMIDALLQNVGTLNLNARNLAGQTPVEACQPADREHVVKAFTDHLAREANLEDLVKPLSWFQHHASENASEELGHGGQGVVYRGSFNGTPAAIKAPHTAPGQSPNRASIAGFRKEVAVWASLGDHENVLPLLGYCETPQFRIASELAPGGDMWSYLWNKKDDAKYFDLAIRILRGVAVGLDYAQTQRAVVHGDLKVGLTFVSCSFSWNVPTSDFNHSPGTF